MLQPKKTKFRRQQKGSQKGNAQRGNQLAFGSFGIKSLETKWITGRQIEAARIAVTRYMQRQGQIWIRIFPDKPITRKPADVRMGKGKGAPEIREIATNELAERIEAEVANYNQMVLNHSISPLDNPAQIKKLRRTIARMKAELHQRELNK